MFVGFYWRILPVLLMTLLGGSVVGCRKHKDDKASSTGAPANPDAVKQSLEGLKPQVAALKKKFRALHEQVDPLPPDLPGFGDVRGKFYATDEAVGRVDYKLGWLSGRLDAALKSSNREELQQVAKDVTQTYDDIRQMDQIAVQLVHEVPPFQKMVPEVFANQSSAPPFTRVLGTGYIVKGVKDGVEERLLQFIEDPQKKVDTTTWFDFDRVFFVGESTEVDALRSKNQLQNVFEIAKAYPNVKLQMAVYNDKLDSTGANKKLSAERAGAVKKELERFGADAPGRLDAGGKGVKHPGCAVGDEACKSKGPRLAVRVSAK